MSDASKRTVAAASRPETAKKPYHAPTLETYGNARDLTKTISGSGPDTVLDGGADGIDGAASS